MVRDFLTVNQELQERFGVELSAKNLRMFDYLSSSYARMHITEQQLLLTEIATQTQTIIDIPSRTYQNDVQSLLNYSEKLGISDNLIRVFTE